MLIDTSIRTIQLMLAPVVMVTALASYINMLSLYYQFMASSIRSMSPEYLVKTTSNTDPGASLSTMDAFRYEALRSLDFGK